MEGGTYLYGEENLWVKNREDNRSEKYGLPRPPCSQGRVMCRSPPHGVLSSPPTLPYAAGLRWLLPR